MQATQLWSLWQGILLPIAESFTRKGQQRFVEWVTGLALNVEEHTVTQSLLPLDRPHDWKALESFAEYGHWHADALSDDLSRHIDRLADRVWHGYRLWVGDDTKVHRNSPDVWGSCTFHEYTAR